MDFEQPQEQKILSQIHWVKPDIIVEMGEIERVAKRFGKTFQEQKSIIIEISQGVNRVELVDLTEDLWKSLENTDSSGVSIGDYVRVHALAEKYNKDDKRLINQMNLGTDMQAPIITQYGNTLHLVSGNTRLMLARAAGQTPKVIIVPLTV